ncbi:MULTISPECIES: hypothetical protein [Bartonella]|nr:MULTISPECIES: hypothetical protein [Bartonella]
MTQAFDGYFEAEVLVDIGKEYFKNLCNIVVMELWEKFETVF